VGYIGIGLGVVAAALALSLVFRRSGLGPLVAWGTAVRVCCPQCGQRALRVGRVIHGQVPDTGARTVGAIVTLCMADGCEYAAVRRLRYWPAAQ
jgi:hypothetical protein